MEKIKPNTAINIKMLNSNVWYSVQCLYAMDIIESPLDPSTILYGSKYTDCRACKPNCFTSNRDTKIRLGSTSAMCCHFKHTNSTVLIRLFLQPKSFSEPVDDMCFFCCQLPEIRRNDKVPLGQEDIVS